MCKLRDHAASQWRWYLAASSVIVLCVCGYFWRADENQKGTLVVKCSSWDYVVEVLSDDPEDDQKLTTADRTPWQKIGNWIRPPNPEYRDWGSDASPSRPLVGSLWVSGDMERRVRLRPGTYHLAIHPKSPCGHYGGTIRTTIEVKQGEQLEYTTP